MGTNTFTVINNVFNYLFNAVANFLIYLGANLGYSAGSILNTTSNVAANTTITSAELAGGAINDVGDIFRDANAQNVSPNIKTEMDKVVNSSQQFMVLPGGRWGQGAPITGAGLWGNKDVSGADYTGLRQDLDDVINKVNRISSGGDGGELKNDTTENPIQKPIGAGKAGWCLVGEFQGKRGCALVDDRDRCTSGQIFATQQLCRGV
jgi:hypothetical protein